MNKILFSTKQGIGILGIIIIMALGGVAGGAYYLHQNDRLLQDATQELTQPTATDTSSPQAILESMYANVFALESIEFVIDMFTENNTNTAEVILNVHSTTPEIGESLGILELMMDLRTKPGSLPGQAPGQTLFQAEARFIGDTYFALIKEFSGTEFGSTFEPILNTWISGNTRDDEAINTISGQTNLDLEELDISANQLLNIKRALSENPFFVVSEQLQDEVVNNKATYRLSLSVDSLNMVNFTQEMRSIFGLPTLSAVEATEFKRQIDAELASGIVSDLEVWVIKDTLLPSRFLISTKDTLNENPIEGERITTLEINTVSFDVPAVVVAPDTSITMEQLFEQLFGSFGPGN